MLLNAMPRLSRLQTLYAAAPIAGLAAFVLPSLSVVLRKGASPVQIVGASVDAASLPTVVLLFVAGFLAGALDTNVRAIRYGLLTIALLPVAAVIEMAVDDTSHNLWPIEFVIYVVTSLVPAVGVLVGRLWSRPPQPHEPSPAGDARIDADNR